MRRARELDEAERLNLAWETRGVSTRRSANRLGIWRLKWELEDLSFRYLEPPIPPIAGWLDESRVDRESLSRP